MGMNSVGANSTWSETGINLKRSVMKKIGLSLKECKDMEKSREIGLYYAHLL